MKNLKIHNRFTAELPADPNEINETRQVLNTLFSYVKPTTPSEPKLIHASEEVAQMIGISADEIQTEEFLNVFSGKEILNVQTTVIEKNESWENIPVSQSLTDVTMLQFSEGNGNEI